MATDEMTERLPMTSEERDAIYRQILESTKDRPQAWEMKLSDVSDWLTKIIVVSATTWLFASQSSAWSFSFRLICSFLALSVAMAIGYLFGTERGQHKSALRRRAR